MIGMHGFAAEKRGISSEGAMHFVWELLIDGFGSKECLDLNEITSSTLGQYLENFWGMSGQVNHVVKLPLKRPLSHHTIAPH